MSGSRASAALTRRIARVLRQALEQGATLEIDGLGKFVPGGGRGVRGVRFVGQPSRGVHRLCPGGSLAYPKAVSGLRETRLSSLARQEEASSRTELPRAIETAIQTFRLLRGVLFAPRHFQARSFHSELRYALNCAGKVPLDEISYSAAPGRLRGARRISRQVQYLDLFPEWEAGISRVIAVIRAQDECRKRKRLSLAG